jgi:hypothetical protein
VLSRVCEAWTITQESEARTAVCYRKILRRKLGPNLEKDSGYRMRHNEELYELLHGPDVAECVKFKRWQHACHINIKNGYY